MQYEVLEDIRDTTKFRYQTIKGVKHYNFRDVIEFKEFFGNNCPVLVENWHDGRQGDWVLSDDGGVVQLLKYSSKISHPGDRPNYSYAIAWVRTVVGTFLIGTNRKRFTMDTDWSKHLSRYTFSGTNKNEPQMQRKRTELTYKEKMFVFAVLYGNTSDVYDVYSKIFKRTSKIYIGRQCRNLLSQERIMDELKKGVEEAAYDLKLDHKWVLKNLKDIAECSAEDKDRIAAIKLVGASLDTFNKSKKKERPLQLPGNGMFEGIGEIEDGTSAKIGERPSMEIPAGQENAE